MRRLLFVAGCALAAVLVFAGAGSADPADYTGTWQEAGGATIWQLDASGDNLTATWKGTTKNGHPDLRGSFNGSLSGNSYSGAMKIDENSVHVTGTMTFTLQSSGHLTVVYTQSNGPHGTITLTKVGVGEPVKIEVSFFANRMPTYPPKDGHANCPSPAAAQISGVIHARITEGGDHQGDGNVADTPFLSKCRVPVIKFKVDHVTVTTSTPSHVIKAVLAVHIDAESVHQPGQCKVGTKGTITAIYNDTVRAPNGLPIHSLRIGPWSGACNAHTHLITNTISKITARSHGSTWVDVFIGCLDSGYSPRNCG